MTGRAKPDDQALVTVIVTLYNVAPYLRRCLDSVLRQTYTDLDILLIDDGSTDGSGEIAAEYAGRDPRVRYIRQENRGVAAARNVGLDQAGGEWIAFVDGDDAMTEDAVATLLEAARSAGVRLSVAGHFVCAETRAPKRVALTETLCRDRMSAQKYFLTGGRDHAFPWGKLYHRSVFDTIRYPEGKIYEDVWSLAALVEGAGGCVAVDRPIYYYYLRDSSITYTKDIGKQFQGLEAWLSYEEFIKRNYPALSPFAGDAVAVSCLYFMGRICRAGRRENLNYWERAVDILRAHLPTRSSDGFNLRMAAALFRVSPVLVGHLCHWYSIWENRT